MSVIPRDSVDAAEAAFGRHPGSRALHAKGTLCRGTFKATAEAKSLTTAAHMQGEPVPATFRFSNASGHPDSPDFAPDLRGLAVKFYLPDGSRTDLVSVTAPVFATRTPEVFVELLKAQGAGAAALVKMPALLGRHPWLLTRLVKDLPVMRPAASYVLLRYYAQHAFRWVGADGAERFVRYTVVPGAGEEPYLRLRDARRRGRDYLQEELRRRLAAGPVRFTLEVQIAEPGDPVDDASREWPASRQRLTVGTFELTGPDTEREQGGDVLVFDPTRVTPGIELSDDAVLHFRSPAYRESVARRSGTGTESPQS
ncbi:MAG TPA: catalase family peroxidase [Solirubrobacteraceae bacterium]|nr:catalase family peroxidase [Solirubrobacteraceae bacterium]